MNQHLAPPRTIPRFTFTERGLHWTHAVFFLGLLSTGLIMLVPGISMAVGHHFLVLRIHLITAIFYVCGPLLWFALGNRRALRADLRDVNQWRGDDFRWLKPRLPGSPEPPQGRFNAGQKINAVFVGASTLGFAITGAVMWQTHLFPIWLVNNCVHLHDTLTLLALAAWLGHIYLALLNRSTRPALSGMVQGEVELSWAEHHHPRWVAEVQDQADAPAAMAEQPPNASPALTERR